MTRVRLTLTLFLVSSCLWMPVFAHSSQATPAEEYDELYEVFKEYRCAITISDAPPLKYFSRDYIETYVALILSHAGDPDRVLSNAIWFGNLLRFADKIKTIHDYSEVIGDEGEGRLVLSYNSESGRHSALYEITYRLEIGKWRIWEVHHDGRDNAAEKTGLKSDAVLERFEDCDGRHRSIPQLDPS